VVRWWGLIWRLGRPLLILVFECEEGAGGVLGRDGLVVGTEEV